MAFLLSIHPLNPQPRLVRQAIGAIRDGSVVVYPTDSCYALGCLIGDKEAMERNRRIRQADRRHNFTLVCRDLSEISRYARVDNSQYRTLRAFTPGPYTSSGTCVSYANGVPCVVPGASGELIR